METLPTGNEEVAAIAGPPVCEQWSYKSSAFLATPPVAMGHFLAVGDRKGYVQFLDPNTGKKRASIKGKGAITGELVWDIQRLYLVTEHLKASLQAFELEGGKRIWYRKFSYPPEAPIKSGDELWLPVGDTLYALDPETGDPVRIIEAGGDFWGTPVPTRSGWVLWGRKGLILALGPDGTRMWSTELKKFCSQPPVASGDTLWISTALGTLVCLAGDGELIFERDLDSTALYAPTLGPDQVVVGAASGTVWALSRTDGSVRWQTSLGAPLSGSPLVHEHWIAASTLDGRLELLAADSGTSLGSKSYPSILASAPVWAFGRLYVTDSDRHVHALGESP